MLFFVTSANLIQLFVGWEGVGLTSYLLIGFWSKKEKQIKIFKSIYIIELEILDLISLGYNFYRFWNDKY